MQCYQSKIKIWGVALLAIMMTGWSFFLTTYPRCENKIMAWLSVIFFGLATLNIPRRLTLKGPIIVIDGKGITDNLYFGLIPWADITSLEIVGGGYYRASFLSIGVHDVDIYLSRVNACKRFFSRLSPLLGYSTISISFACLSPGLNEACDYIKNIHPGKITRKLRG